MDNLLESFNSWWLCMRNEQRIGQIVSGMRLFRGLTVDFINESVPVPPNSVDSGESKSSDDLKVSSACEFRRGSQQTNAINWRPFWKSYHIRDDLAANATGMKLTADRIKWDGSNFFWSVTSIMHSKLSVIGRLELRRWSWFGTASFAYRFLCFFVTKELERKPLGECQQSKQQLATNGIDSVGEVIFCATETAIEWTAAGPRRLECAHSSQRHPTAETK